MLYYIDSAITTEHRVVHLVIEYQKEIKEFKLFLPLKNYRTKEVDVFIKRQRSNMEQVTTPLREASEHSSKTCFIQTAGSTLDEHDHPLDRRIQRTRQLLREALFELIIERGYEKIAIAEITERANIGRTTFYLHYQEKEDLLKASLRTLMGELHLEVEPSADEICPYAIRCVRIFQHVAQRQHLYQALLQESGSVNIGNVMQTYFAELFQHYMLDSVERENSSSLRNELIAAHAAGSLFGLISWWLRHGVSPSAEQMGSVYFQLMAKGAENLPLSSVTEESLSHTF